MYSIKDILLNTALLGEQKTRLAKVYVKDIGELNHHMDTDG